MIDKLAEYLKFPSDAIEYLNHVYYKIMNSSEFKSYAMLKHQFMNDAGDEYLTNIKNISFNLSINEYALSMILCLDLAQNLHTIYLKKNIPEKIFVNSMQDLLYKLKECHMLYNVWGTPFISWHRHFYKLEQFGFGRLQCDKYEFLCDDYKGILKRGDLTYSIHIPSSGPLYIEEVIKSLKEAYTLFEPQIDGKIMVFTCSSWLLYDKTISLFPEKSNIRKFYNLFDIIANREDEKNADFWRIFGIQYSEADINNLPLKTSLQKNFQEYFRSGNHMGSGYGILLFDGQNIVNKEGEQNA